LIQKGFKRTKVIKGGDGEMMKEGFPFVIDGKIHFFERK
jgi:hypothetical protein